MIGQSSNYMGCKQTSPVNIEEMQNIIGEKFSVSKVINVVADMDFSSGEVISKTGSWLEINNKYLICNSGFIKEKNWGAIRIQGDGEFTGSLDVLGLKIMHAFFSGMKNGSIIYINDEKKTLMLEGKEVKFL